MNKATSLQELFDELPLSVLKESTLSEEAADEETTQRILKNACKKKKRPAIFGKKRLYVAVIAATLAVVMAISAVALTSYMFTPQYGFSRPNVIATPSIPLVGDYEKAVTVGQTVENDGLRVTFDKFAVDETEKCLRMLIAVESTDGEPLVELTAERMSIIARTSFQSITLYRDGVPVRLQYRNGAVFRVDDAADPFKASFQINYNPLGADKTLVGKAYVLELKNLRDTVRVSQNIGFQYASLGAMYESMKPAAETDFIPTKERAVTDKGISYYYILPDSGQHVKFSSVYDKAYIDNIALRYDPIEDIDRLYIAFSGLVEGETWPVLIDMRDGGVYGAVLWPLDDYGQLHEEYTNLDCAEMMGLVDDKGRVTLYYDGVAEEDLPYLFMMGSSTEEIIVRKEGVWSIPFTVKETDGTQATVFAIDEEFVWNEYHFHATSVALTDSAIYVQGTYEVVPVPEGEEQYATIYGNISLKMKDGTVINDVMWQGVSADLQTNGDCCYGGMFNRFVDSENVESIVLFGETVMLDDPV